MSWTIQKTALVKDMVPYVQDQEAYGDPSQLQAVKTLLLEELSKLLPNQLVKIESWGGVNLGPAPARTVQIKLETIYTFEATTEKQLTAA